MEVFTCLAFAGGWVQDLLVKVTLGLDARRFILWVSDFQTSASLTLPSFNIFLGLSAVGRYAHPQYVIEFIIAAVWDALRSFKWPFSVSMEAWGASFTSSPFCQDLLRVALIASALAILSIILEL